MTAEYLGFPMAAQTVDPWVVLVHYLAGPMAHPMAYCLAVPMAYPTAVRMVETKVLLGLA